MLTVPKYPLQQHPGACAEQHRGVHPRLTSFIPPRLEAGPSQSSTCPSVPRPACRVKEALGPTV